MRYSHIMRLLALYKCIVQNNTTSKVCLHDCISQSKNQDIETDPCSPTNSFSPLYYSPLSTSWYLLTIDKYHQDEQPPQQLQHLLVRSKSTEFVRDRKARAADGNREEGQKWQEWQPRRLVQRAKSTHWLQNL